MSDKSQSIVLAGVSVGIAAAILNLIPVAGGCLACLVYLGAGVVAVWHYTDRHHVTLKGGEGAGLGALAGILAGAVSFALQWLFQAIGLAPNWRVAMEEQFEQSGMDPAQMEQIIEMLSSPLVMIGIVLGMLIIYAILGALGGVMGASFFKKGADHVG